MGIATGPRVDGNTRHERPRAEPTAEAYERLLTLSARDAQRAGCVSPLSSGGAIADIERARRARTQPPHPKTAARPHVLIPSRLPLGACLIVITGEG
jgi:hypothetical protein